MTDFRGRFDPAELDPDTDAELAGLLATARDLEAFARSEGAGPRADFEDRVMAAVALEPPPRPIAVGGLLASLRDAWRILWSGGRPIAVRAQALALVLLVAVALGSAGTVAGVGLARLLEPDGTPPPAVPSPSPSPSPTTAPRQTPSPTPTATPTATPTPTGDETPEPTETANPTKTTEPGGGDEADERDESHETAEPHETEEPHETDEPGHESGSGGSDRGDGERPESASEGHDQG